MKLRVATYNIHKGVMGLRKKVRIHDVRLALKAIDADIVFLQEVQDKNERMSRRVDYPNGTQLDYLCTGSYLHRASGPASKPIPWEACRDVAFPEKPGLCSCSP